MRVEHFFHAVEFASPHVFHLVQPPVDVVKAQIHISAQFAESAVARGSEGAHVGVEVADT